MLNSMFIVFLLKKVNQRSSIKKYKTLPQGICIMNEKDIISQNKIGCLFLWS